MNAYIVTGYRTAFGKSGRGGLRFTRPDDLAATVIRHMKAQLPQFDWARVDDLLVGNAIPEADQGLNMARMVALLALNEKVPAATVNRYCASGLETIAMASAKIHAGMADAIVAGGSESMSLIPMGGYKIVPNYEVARNHPEWYFSMGLTAEAVAEKYKVSREDCDAFALQSNRRAVAAQQTGRFTEEIVPVEVKEVYVDDQMKRKERTFTVAQDEGPRADTTPEALAKLKPAFTAKGVSTAGNSSQTSDGAAFVLVVSERFLKEYNLTPIARLAGYGVAGVAPEIMGIGPVAAVPLALKTAGLGLKDITTIELNEAFASQSLAVMRELDLNPAIVNPNGGAIALGHPLGCTGAALTVKLIHELRRQNGRYGLVTACVGGGQGIAGVIERLN
ncbi:MAG: acetyl-CoA C-acyltransferase [Bacteroidetes bacterium]|nr:acetyl-CoA C-acyltransferase [Bacteroidota bacterium]